MAKRCWLLKSEPDAYSIDDLARDGRTFWSGVRNYQARNFLKDEMRPGDRVLFYHSNAEPSGVAGVAEVVSEGYPDPTAFDRRSEYYDPRSDRTRPTWFVVDVAFVEKLPRVVPLAELKARKDLAGMLVTKRGMRLSVQPVETKHFDIVVRMGRGR
jgi:predicted RNA-binding protein with PUA-like domain